MNMLCSPNGFLVINPPLWPCRPKSAVQDYTALKYCNFLNHLKMALTVSCQGRPGGVVVYQYTRKKFIQIYPKLYPGILYTRSSKKVMYRILKKPLYTVYPKTLADPELWALSRMSFKLRYPIHAKKSAPFAKCYLLNLEKNKNDRF